MTDISELSLVEVAAAIREKRLSSVEVTQACLARINAIGPSLNAFISVEAQAALEAFGDS